MGSCVYRAWNAQDAARRSPSPVNPRADPTSNIPSRLISTPAHSRYFTEGAFDPIAVVAGLIQTAIYADFGYIVSHPLTVLTSDTR